VKGYPDAERLDLVEVLHGRRVADPYRWLEDLAEPRTKEWAGAQDELTRRRLDALPGRDALSAELHGLLDAGWVSVPSWRAGRRFGSRRGPGQEHAVVTVCDAATEAGQRVLLDPMVLDPTGRTTLDGWAPDDTGRRVSYKLSTGGDEQSVLRVLDVDTGEVIDGPIDRGHAGSVDWFAGGERFVHVRKLTHDRDDFRRRIWVHRVGTDPVEDVLVEGPGLYDEHTYYGVNLSRDGRWLIVTGRVGTARRDSLWIARVGPDGAVPELTPILTQADDVQAGAGVARDGRLWVFTTDGAPRWRLVVTDPRTPTREHWQEVLAEDPHAVLTGLSWIEPVVAGGQRLLAVARRRHAVSELTLHSATDGAPHGVITLPGTGSLAGMSSADPATAAQYGRLWFGWSDLVTPHAVYRFNLADGAVVRESGPPGQISVPEARTEHRSYTSADGTTVRMFVVSPAGPRRPRPTLLYGYGGFANALTPGFSAAATSWVAAGGTYASASLRGGGEEGEAWHRAGQREHRQNVFDDFHAAARSLVDSGDTTPEQLAIMGGSNGGLLVGVALTQAPARYRAVVCANPLLDMVRYERFLLGRTWNDEYGSAEDPGELGWLLGYSPYHHVREGEVYPAVLFTVPDADTRVDPLHARKMCAALQHATAGDPQTRPVLLLREADVGHGARSVSRSVALLTDKLAFLAAHTGLDLTVLRASEDRRPRPRRPDGEPRDGGRVHQ